VSTVQLGGVNYTAGVPTIQLGCLLFSWGTYCKARGVYCIAGSVNYTAASVDYTAGVLTV
jgi:hypothetical protein